MLTYKSIFSASNWVLEPLFLTVKVFRKLTGILELPGILEEDGLNDERWLGFESRQSQSGTMPVAITCLTDHPCTSSFASRCVLSYHRIIADQRETFLF